MSGLLAGKRGIVFGVANEHSIAWHCAEACANQGAELVLGYQRELLASRATALGAKLATQGRVLQCDLTEDEDIARFFGEVRAEWDRVDFVIHSVAFAKREDLKGRLVDTPRDHFTLALDVSAYTLLAVIRAAEPLLAPESSIVTMSYYGARKVIPRYNVMGVAKAALEAEVRYLAGELGPQGVRVNAVCAGAIRTLAASAIPGFSVMLDKVERNAPLRRNVTPTEVGKAAVYLVSDLSSGVTGEILNVDCGYNIIGMTLDPRNDSDAAR